MDPYKKWEEKGQHEFKINLYPGKQELHELFF